MKKLLSEHASSGVTKYLVSGHLTSERPNWSEHPGSITLPSGDAPKYGASILITSPDLKTFTDLLIEDIYVWYCSKAIGSYLSPWLVYLDEKGFGFIRFCTKDSWFLFLSRIRPKLEAVNRNFLSNFHSGHSDWLRVLISMPFSLSSSTCRSFNSDFSASERSAGISNCSLDWLDRGNLGYVTICSPWLAGFALGIDVMSQNTLKLSSVTASW